MQMPKIHRTSLSIASAFALGLGAIALAQSTTPPPAPGDQPSRNPPPSDKPPVGNPGGKAQERGPQGRPAGTDAVDAAIPDDTIQLFKDAQFKDTVVQIDGVSKGSAATTAKELPGGMEDSLTAIRWNLPAGVVVIFYEDDGAKGEQFIIWGKGQVPSVAKWDFDNKASQYVWYNLGGADNPPPHLARPAGTGPLGTEPASGAPAENSMQLFKSKNYAAPEATISSVNTTPQAAMQTLPGPISDSMTSLRWNLPPGALVVFYQDAGGLKQQAAIFGSGQIPDVDLWDFNDKVSRWAWYDVGGSTEHAAAPGTAQPPAGRIGSGGR